MINSTAEKSKRIAKNTLLLYFRMLFTLIISLYTSRVVLDALGVNDYGVYNVVGGVVAMFSLLSGSLSSAVTRFLTFELGREDNLKLKKVFSTSVTIHATLALLVFIIAEIGGVWFVKNKMTIEPERIDAALWVLHFSIVAFVCRLISVPYNAAIIAHEKMKAFAYIGVLEVVLRLFAVLSLKVILFDKLVIYGLLMLLVAIVVQAVYLIYCTSRFEECTYKFMYDKEMLKEMSSFAGWNMIGAASNVLRGQGTNILINIFCGPAVNAARGISFQVNNAVNQFVNNFMTAVKPQITKSYASGDFKYMMLLIFQSARLSFYMLLFLSLPILINTHYVLSLWLTVVPKHTVLFVRLIIIYSMCESLSMPLITAMLATGRIKKYQIIVGGLQMLNFPLSWLLLRIGLFPEITIVIFIMLSFSCLCARLILLRNMIGLSAKDFVIKVIVNILYVSFIAILLPLFISYYFNGGLIAFIMITLSCLVMSALAIYFVGCNKNEREFIDKHLKKFLRNKLSVFRK